MMSDYRYFIEEEFRKAVPSCSLSQMDEEFMSMLDAARHLAGIPFIVNSAYRSMEYEKKKGRSGTSMHCEGRAVDLRCRTSDDRFRIVASLIASGFHRIGIADTFIHVDNGYSKSHPLIWLY